MTGPIHLHFTLVWLCKSNVCVCVCVYVVRACMPVCMHEYTCARMGACAFTWMLGHVYHSMNIFYMFCLPKTCYAIGTAGGWMCVSMASVQICGSVHLVHTPTSLCTLVVPASSHNWAAQYPHGWHNISHEHRWTVWFWHNGTWAGSTHSSWWDPMSGGQVTRPFTTK